jgi:hypothetical protein
MSNSVKNLRLNFSVSKKSLSAIATATLRDGGYLEPPLSRKAKV